MIETTNAHNPITEKIAKAYMALGKLESIIDTGSIPKEEIKISLYRSRTVFDALITMSQFTLNKADIIDAHSAVGELQHIALKTTTDPFEKRGINAFVECIHIALPPKPMPTMADIEWDDEKHFLAEAEHSKYGKVIMIGDAHLHTLVINPNDDITKTAYVDSARLTPTGRRYTLTD